MRAVLATVVLLAAVPVCAAGAAVFLLGLGIGWCAVKLAPQLREDLDTFGVPLRSVR